MGLIAGQITHSGAYLVVARCRQTSVTITNTSNYIVLSQEQTSPVCGYWAILCQKWFIN